MKQKVSWLPWLVVSAVGVYVLVLVAGLNLFPRIDAAQNLIDGLAPAFTPERVAGARGGIEELSAAVQTVDPIMTPQGGASAEVGDLISFMSMRNSMSQAEVVSALQTNFPKTTNLLLALPLSDVSAEIPKLVSFLSTNLNMSQDQVMGVLQQKFPKLAQVMVNLPKATSAWNNVPGIENLTRFDGSKVTTVPQVRDYFSKDVIPVLETQETNFKALAARGGVGYIPALLVTIAIVALVFSFLMMAFFHMLSWDKFLIISTGGWIVVIAVGIIVLMQVYAVNLTNRLAGGQQVLDTARSAFTHQRVAGDIAAIKTVDTVVKAFDPAVTPAGGAAAEVPKLIAFLADKLHMTQAQVVETLHQNFPKTLALLSALPLTEVNAEIEGKGDKPGLVPWVATFLRVQPPDVVDALQQSFPHILQAVLNLPTVVIGWNDVPHIDGLTRFDGSAVKTVPDVVAYFQDDVIPAVAAQEANYQLVDTTWPRLTVFSPLLVVTGFVVILFGLLMLIVVLKIGATAESD